MSHNILITGGSGYLGGTLLARWATANIPSHNQLFALVRSDEQAKAVLELYGATPLNIDLRDPEKIKQSLIDRAVTVVVFFINAYSDDTQLAVIDGLAEVQRITGVETHFVHTTGTKQFSEHAGAPADAPLLDTKPDLYDIQKSQRAPAKEMQLSIETNSKIVEAGLAKGVKTYIVAPCIVYGKGEGFGNKTSIQTVDIVIGAKAAGAVYKFDEPGQIWSVCHISDTIGLYTCLLRAILSGGKPGNGKQGYYLASSGKMHWDDIYAAMATALHKRGVIASERVEVMTDEALGIMAEALGVGRESVKVKIAGRCTFEAGRGREGLGWTPVYSPEHILEALDEEVELILGEMEGGLKVGHR